MARDKNRATRTRIQAAALVCFRQKGFDGTTMAEIARQAGVSPGSIYLRFPGKRQLFDSLRRPDLDFPAPRRRERREEILAAALDVFSHEGYAGTTMDGIAKAAGLSKAALYGYFPGKQELFAAVLANAPVFALLETLPGDGLMKAMDPHSSHGPAPADPEPVLRRVALAYLRMFRDRTMLNMLRIILAEGGRDPEIAATFRLAAVERGSARLTEYLESRGYGPKEELPAMIQAFMGMLFSWVVMHRALARSGKGAAGGGAAPQSGDFPDQEEKDMAERAVRLFLHGLGPRTGLTDRPH